MNKNAACCLGRNKKKQFCRDRFHEHIEFSLGDHPGNWTQNGPHLKRNFPNSLFLEFNLIYSTIQETKYSSTQLFKAP